MMRSRPTCVRVLPHPGVATGSARAPRPATMGTMSRAMGVRRHAQSRLPPDGRVLPATVNRVFAVVAETALSKVPSNNAMMATRCRVMGARHGALSSNRTLSQAGPATANQHAKATVLLRRQVPVASPCPVHRQLVAVTTTTAAAAARATRHKIQPLPPAPL
jgi:hypothetical protein